MADLASQPETVRRVARIEDENAGLVLFTVCIAAIASLAAVTLQLVSSRGLHGSDLALHYLYTGLTVAGSWLMIGCIFSLHYALACSTPPREKSRHCASRTMNATRITGISTTSRSLSMWRYKRRMSVSLAGRCDGWCWHIHW
ncbi:hypothetical protein PspTeo4_10384 [Pseudomonas sp. Teo4]|nr:hypothetical protein [Pseudomonas sp. Teo4]